MKWVKWVRKRGEGRLDIQGKRNKILDKEKVKDRTIGERAKGKERQNWMKDIHTAKIERIEKKD